MAAFALIHGGGGSALDRQLGEAELRRRGHDTVAIDLPSEDASAGWWEYAETVVGAVGDRVGPIAVANSLGRPRELADRLDAYAGNRTSGFAERRRKRSWS